MGAPILSSLLAFRLLAPGVEWDAPPQCPDAATIRARLEGVHAQPAHTVTARVLAPESPQTTWRLELEVGDGPTRHLEGENCDALADALVAMLSVQATAEAGPSPALPLPPPAVPTPPTLPPATADPPTAASPPATATPQPRPPTPHPSASDVVLGVAGGVHGLSLPRPGGGLGLSAGLELPHLRLAGYGQWWFRRTRDVTSAIEAAYRLAIGGVELCAVGRFGRLGVLGCGLVEAGELHAEGIGAAPPRTQRHLWIAPGGKAGLRWRVRGPIWLGLSLDALAPLRRYAFHVGDLPAGEVGPVDLRGLVHVEVAIPGRRIRDGR